MTMVQQATHYMDSDEFDDNHYFEEWDESDCEAIETDECDSASTICQTPSKMVLPPPQFLENAAKLNISESEINKLIIEFNYLFQERPEGEGDSSFASQITLDEHDDGRHYCVHCLVGKCHKHTLCFEEELDEFDDLFRSVHY